MPSAFDHLSDPPPKKGKTLQSAFDSESFDADGTIHVDGLVGSATIAPSGRDVALASPDGLAIIDLDSPYSPPRRLSSHGLPWLVVDVQWSPFAARDYWVASTANHRCLVWNLNLRDDSSSGAIEHSLHGHSRAITDMNFSAHHPDMLATCAVDGYVHCWDLRRPRQPALTFCDWFAGGTQVKYNRQDAHVLASAHDRFLRIWDDRKPSEALKSIEAHKSKIYGLDWNRTHGTSVVTCSLDRSIKFWDYDNDVDVPQRVIRTDFPVWRARHTPFGWGLLAMPQNEPGRLYLYDRRTNEDEPVDEATKPVAVFAGHGNHKVKEFLWRSRGSIEDDFDNRDFQLVSWGEDNELRLQKMEPKHLEPVGFVKGVPVRENLLLTRKGATYKTFRTVDDNEYNDRKAATMSDPRGGSGNSQRSAVTLGIERPHQRLGPAWKGSSMRAKSGPNKNVDRSALQIGWMKGIQILKRKTGVSTPVRQDSKDSSMFSPGYHDDWGEPETVHEEFVRLTNQLPNVKWENIDMDNLTLNASLKGPWGVNGDSIFIKVKVDIPTSYPKSKPPKFVIEKSSFTPEATHRKIDMELQQIAYQFLQRKQNCLTVAFSYLLGEVDLESSTNFFKNVRDFDDLEGLGDESSSDEEDPGGGSAHMSQELTASTELDPTATLATTQRTAIPPPPRYCGARFSRDGRLVCFFPTKEEKARALFSMPSLDTYREKPKGEPSFAGFGRLSQDSPPPKQRFTHDEASTDDLSDGSVDSSDSSSSSDSELTTLHKVNFWYQPNRFRKALSADDSVRSSGGGTGNGTGTGTQTTRRRTGKPRNIVSLYDLSEDLPSKRELAEEYAVFGDGGDVCEHNAKVAEKYGYSDIVDVWRYAGLLLSKGIPLELHQQHHRHESVLVIAQDMVARAKDENYRVDGQMTEFSGRVRWGFHPLAHDFIHDLFDYFESLADIQMLAMLSCVFGDSSTEDSVAYAESHLTLPETPLPMKAPSFSLEYFPTDPTRWHSQTSSAITTPRTAETPAMYSDSQNSENLAAWLGDPASNSYSCGETPPKSSREQFNAAMAATLAVNFPRAIAGMVSSSPPEPLSRKRPSPAENFLSNFNPSSITWGGTSVFGPTPEPTSTARTSVSDDESRREEIVAMVPVGVSCVMENQTLFDDDGWLSTPLLEPSRSRIYSNYRYAYAGMLQVWGQPLARLEIMKFDVLNDASLSSDTTVEDTIHESPKSQRSAKDSKRRSGTASPTIPLGGPREQLQALLASGRGVDVKGLCRMHEEQLDPLEYSRPTHGQVGGAVGTCHKCATASAHRPKTATTTTTTTAAAATTPAHHGTPQTQLRCVYCAEPVAALYAACLGCGCVLHEGCLAEWHAHGETECPAGDECCCVDEAANGQIESWPALQASLVRQLRIPALAARPSWHGGGGGGIHTRSSAFRALAAAHGQGRPRRKSVPARLGGPGGTGIPGGAEDGTSSPVRSQHDGTDREDEDGRDDADWESVGSSREIPSMSRANSMMGAFKPAELLSELVGGTASAGKEGGGGGGRGGKPPPMGDEPVSAARLSLGNRLKKSLAEGGRPGIGRKKSGSVGPGGVGLDGSARGGGGGWRGRGGIS